MNKNFFIITKDNYNCYQNRMYGIYFDGVKFYINISPGKLVDIYDYGFFINFYRNKEKIVIQQDYFGSYGLFIYKKDSYWALSNSLLYLVLYLKDCHKLSFNKDYALFLLSSEMVPLILEDTLISEIKQLPPDFYIEIDLQTGDLELLRTHLTRYTIKIDSREGIDLIDCWHSKWNSLIKYLSKNNFPVIADLSGGFDTRAAFTTLFKQNLNFNYINVNSYNDNLHSHKEDYIIAKKISSLLNFKLNTKVNLHKIKLSSNDSLNNTYFIKSSYHKELYFKSYYTKTPTFQLTGSGGEGLGSLSSRWYKSPKEFLNEISFYNLHKEYDLNRGILKIFNKTVDYIQNNYKDNIHILNKLYNLTRLRYHFGKSIVESININNIALAVLMDPILYKINQNVNDNYNNKLFFSLIYNRYLPEIENVEFEANRSIDNNTKALSKQINNKFPHIPCINMDLSLLYRDCIYENSDSKACMDPRKFTEKIFFSNEFKYHICKLISKDFYRHAKLRLINQKYFGDSDINTLLSIDLFYRLVNNKNNKFSSILDDIECKNNGEFLKVLNVIQRARVDIISKNDLNNKVEILSSNDSNLKYSFPKWFSYNNGSGCVIETNKSFCILKIKNIYSGKMLFTFRGPDIKKDGNRLKLMVDYKIIKIFSLNKNKVVYYDNKIHPTWHDSPFVVRYFADKGEILFLTFEFIPHNYTKIDIIKLINLLY